VSSEKFRREFRRVFCVLVSSKLREEEEQRLRRQYTVTRSACSQQQHTPLMEPMVEHGELGVDFPADRTPCYRKSYSPSVASAAAKREMATSKRISLAGNM